MDFPDNRQEPRNLKFNVRVMAYLNPPNLFSLSSRMTMTTYLHSLAVLKGPQSPVLALAYQIDNLGARLGLTWGRGHII